MAAEHDKQASVFGRTTADSAYDHRRSANDLVQLSYRPVGIYLLYSTTA